MYKFLSLVYQQRYMIKMMALREIRNRYVGSLIGVFWSVIQPIIMVAIYWFVFSLGFRVQPQGNVPFVIWFFCAFVAWTSFSEMVTLCTNSIVVNGNLIKKTLFPSEILPLVYVTSSGISHLIMLGILIFMIMISNLPFSIYMLLIPYYYLGLVLLMVGLGWLFSALNVFIRDIGQLVSVVMQIWFWLTPVFWQIEMLPEKLHKWIKLNPLYYIVDGYRNAVLYNKPFWDAPLYTLYFWCVVLSVFFIGGRVFRKLQPEFADVL